MVVERKGTQFRVVAQGFSTDWWKDTPSNRKGMVVFLRSLEDALGKPLFTYDQLAQVLESSNRQAAQNYIQAFAGSGGDLGDFLARKRKVDGEVVEAVEVELERDLWVGMEALAERVNSSLGREGLTASNMAVALDQVSGRRVRQWFLRAVARGEAHYQERYVLGRLFSWVSWGMRKEESGVAEGVLASLEQATEPLGGEELELGDKGVQVQERLLEEQEVTPEGLASVWESALGWVILAFALYMQGVSLSVIGSWLGVDKSTVCRWFSQLAPVCWGWVQAQKVAFSGQAEVDEKWVFLAGVWWYLFAAVDSVTGYPLHVVLYPSNSGFYCKLFLLELKRKGYIPKVIVTDGWDAYVGAIAEVFPKAEHLLCRFHLIRSVFRRLRRAGVWEGEVWKGVGKLFQTRDKRTVRRRVARLVHLVEGLGKGKVVSGLVAKLPQVIGAIGSTWRSSTANGVERFFGAFDRFYRVKGPFCDQASAEKHLQLFVVWYLLRVGAKGQACPLQRAGGQVDALPLYHLLNRPKVHLLRERMAQQYRQVA
jgi:transposase-like protein